MSGVEWSPFSWTLGTVLVLTVLLWSLWTKLRDKRYPPVYSGWLPWMGCALEFGANPLLFVNKTKEKLGSVFTLYVAGERLTFLTEADDFDHFFKSEAVDFQKAVQDPVQNVASVSQQSFFTYHTQIHDLVKGKLGRQRLAPFEDSLNAKCVQLFKEIQPGRCSLQEVVRQTLYRGVIHNLFGEGTLPIGQKEEFQKMEKNFVLFDELFEYGARLPSFMIREWTRAKWYLISLFRKATRDRNDQGTLLDDLLGLLEGDEKHRPNYSLLLLWASLANAVPITFWTLAYITSHPQVLQKVQNELQENLSDSVLETGIPLSLLEKLTFTKYCVMEAIRLNPTGIITRRVVEDFKLHNFIIPRGDMLMISPYWAHRNPKFFPDPLSYRPERWSSAALDAGSFLPGFVAFGGGRYQCPGRWYALMEIHLFISMFLYQFDVEPLSDIPQASMKHVVGTQQPEMPYYVQLKRKLL